MSTTERAPKRLGFYTCTFEMEVEGLEAWARPLKNNYYVLRGEEVVGYIGSGAAGHYYLSILTPHQHTSWSSRGNTLEQSLREIKEKLTE